MKNIKIHIDDKKMNTLNALAAVEGKSINDICVGLIEEIISDKKDLLINHFEKKELNVIMKASESSFSEWINKEDEIYDSL
jgi:hypothetical protein